MKPSLKPLADRGPLRVMFVTTSMPVGGAETLLVNLVRRMDRERFAPELCCLKDAGPLGQAMAREIPVFKNLLAGKYDLRIARRLPRLFRKRRIDAVITVGAGDKMFWGRLAAWRAGVPVIASALHSTGWPDVIGRLNRRLTRITDAFIAVAAPHGKYLAEVERFPAAKIHVIPNGVDTDRFRPLPAAEIRAELNLHSDDPVVGIVAALRPEKNHTLLLQAIRKVRERLPKTRLLIVGDGPERAAIMRRSSELGLGEAVTMLGTREDIPHMLAAVDVFALTSHMEANPVSILEALACGKPVVATDVGSVRETVRHGETGYLAPPGSANQFADRILDLLADREKARRYGEAGRRLVTSQWSLDTMVAGYERLIASIYESKCARPAAAKSAARPATLPDPAEAIDST